MQIIKEEELISLEEEYSKLLKSLLLTPTRNRFSENFDTYRLINAEMQRLNTNVVPSKWIERYRNATYDLLELLSICRAVKDYPYPEVLREKIKLLNMGVSSPALETASNNKARNVQFELALFSQLNEVGLKCYLKDPRPDIEVLSVGRSYAIECKRVFSMSDSSVNNLIGDAKNQLEQALELKSLQTGIIALDITRRLTSGTDHLRAESEEAAKARLSYEIEKFGKQYQRYWSPQRIKNKRITTVILHASLYTYIEDKGHASHGAFSVIQEVHPEPYSKILFRQAFEDVYMPLSKHKAGGSPSVLVEP